MKKMKILIIMFGSFFINPVFAQNQSCMSKADFIDFDFWLGEWNVFLNNSNNSNQVGTNIIEKIEGECALTETWAGARGSSGISINYYNSVRDEWW